MMLLELHLHVMILEELKHVQLLHRRQHRRRRGELLGKRDWLLSRR